MKRYKIVAPVYTFTKIQCNIFKFKDLINPKAKLKLLQKSDIQIQRKKIINIGKLVIDFDKSKEVGIIENISFEKNIMICEFIITKIQIDRILKELEINTINDIGFSIAYIPNFVKKDYETSDNLWKIVSSNFDCCSVVKREDLFEEDKNCVVISIKEIF